MLGGGAAGCSTAIDLAEVGYDVTLFEKCNELMIQTSASTARRLHLGFHYNDIKTALKCQICTLNFMHTFPGIYRGSNSSISAENSSHLTRGQYFVVKEEIKDPAGQREEIKVSNEPRDSKLDGPSDSKLDDSIDSKVNEPSESKLIDQMEKLDDLRKNYKKWCREHGTEILGPPAQFYRIMSQEELDGLDGMINTKMIQLGIETAECSLDWEVLRTSILQKIDLQNMSANNIQVITQAEVLMVESSFQQEEVYEDGLAYRVTYKKTDSDGCVRKMRIDADIVINCTWENIEFFNDQLNMVKRVRTNLLKAIAEVALPTAMINTHSMFFCYGDYCSLTNYGNGIGYLSYEPVTKVEHSTGLTISESMKRKLYGPRIELDDNDIGNRILEGAIKFIPGLRGASVKRVLYGIVRYFGVVSKEDQSAIHSRRDSGVHEHCLGYVENGSMKLMYFLDNAAKVKDIVMKTMMIISTAQAYIETMTELIPMEKRSLLHYFRAKHVTSDIFRCDGGDGKGTVDLIKSAVDTAYAMHIVTVSGKCWV